MYDNYSVKSGYNMLLESTGRVDKSAEQEHWSSLWKINAPPKAKHLLWRICRGCIPTRTRLHDMCVPCPLTCPLCEQCNEDEWHVFFNCNDSFQAIQTARLDHLISARVQNVATVSELILAICHDEEYNTAGQFSMLLWTLWNNRNDKVWNGTQEAGRRLGYKALQAWHEWASVQQEKLTSVQQQQTITWQKPPLGWSKCNFDLGFIRILTKKALAGF
jgi:hypothetical protein